MRASPYAEHDDEQTETLRALKRRVQDFGEQRPLRGFAEVIESEAPWADGPDASEPRRDAD